MKKYWASFESFIARPERVFLSLCLLFGLLSAFFVPQLSVSDENMHYLRAYALADGRLESKRCTYPVDVNGRASSVYHGNISADYSRPINRSELKTTSKCNSAVGYAPIMHAPQTLGIFIANLFNGSTGLTILFGRIANLLFYALSVFFIIKWVRIGKWVFAVVGLLPLMVHLAASLSSDVMTNVAIFLITATTLNLYTQETPIRRKQVAGLLAIAALLALTKAVNGLLLFPLLFLPGRLFISNTRLPKLPSLFKKLPFNLHKWALIAGAGIVSLAALLIWQKIYDGALLSSGAADNPLHHNPLGFIRILFNTYINPNIGYTDIVVRGSVGDFSSFKYHLPLFVLIPLFLLVFLALIKRDKAEEQALAPAAGRLAAANLTTVAVFIAAVSYAMYTAWALLPIRFGAGAYYADGVQGRYFTALLVLLIPCGVWLRKYIWFHTASAKVFHALIFFGCGAILLYYTFGTYWAYHAPIPVPPVA